MGKNIIIIIITCIIIIILCECYKKMPFLSVFCNFLRADGNWEVILLLKSIAPCRCIYVGVHLKPSASQLVEKAVKVMYAVGAAACTNHTVHRVLLHSDIIKTLTVIKKLEWREHD